MDLTKGRYVCMRAHIVPLLVVGSATAPASTVSLICQDPLPPVNVFV